MKPMPHLPSRQGSPRIEPLSVLPVFFDLEAKRVIVIGGTSAAAWKAELLAAAGAHVDIYAVGPSEEMLTLASNGGAAGAVRLFPEGWDWQVLAGAALIVADAATSAEAMDIRKAARAAGVPVNLIDRPEFGDFQFGSLVNRSPLVIGISTSGAAPVLAQMVRSRIESIIPAHVAAWTAIARRIRDLVSERFATARHRRVFWEGFAARAMLRPPNALECVEPRCEVAAAPGQVTVIEVATADDLNLRAIRALQTADVIHLIGRCPAGILDLARREAKRVHHSLERPAALEEESGNRVIIRGRAS
jgi:uroporphyrin-III C-methyltransferase/precorrin-2 dehydrogenase/sirohydrochlorin ferrochelatase